MTDDNCYGVSPKKPNRKSCLNCVYLQLKKHPHKEYAGDYIWYGQSASCHHDIWKRGFSEMLSELFYHVDIEEYARLPDGSYCEAPLSPRKLKGLLREDYGLTRIPLAESEDGFIELAKFKCRRFYPKKKRNQRTLEACWKDQQAYAEQMKFWVPVSISLLILAFSGLSLWRFWQ